MTRPSQQEALRSRLESLGFDSVRFAAVTDAPLPPLREWLADGMHADMHWLDRSAEKRLQPALVLSGARSIIMLGVSYWSEKLAWTGHDARSSPVWARYAVHEDYHDTMKPALAGAGQVLEELFGLGPQDYRYYVDTGPILERTWAARAGIGFTGKNAMLISRQHGNWLFLASILTRMDFTPDEPVRNHFRARDVGLLCGSCTRCLDACPTQAFAAPGVVDSRRCISYQTIENKAVIPRELRAGIGNRIYGCDVCLEVCPWNRFAREGRRLLIAARHEIAALSLAEILALTPERFALVFRRTPIKRLKLVGLLRNACVVAGNVGDQSVLPLLVAHATSHASPIVRAHAVWAVHRLNAAALLATAAAGETDPLVLAEYDAEKSFHRSRSSFS
jgi:epoxyqueuosine reductase